MNSHWDPTQAPPGKHVAGGDVFLPHGSSFTTAEWDEINRSYADRFLETWSTFAPNMTAGNVLEGALLNPGDYERKLAFQLGSDQYRTDIRGLYLCGVSTYPGGGAHGACGYNAFHAISEDLNLSGLPRSASGSASRGGAR